MKIKLMLIALALLVIAPLAQAQSLPAFKFVGLYDGGKSAKYGLSYDLAPVTKDGKIWITAVVATATNGGERVWPGAALTYRLVAGSGLSFDFMAGLTANVFEQSFGEASSRWFVGLGVTFRGG